MPSHAEFQNRLIHEKSPYLLQHADNPVDWYPWGEEAFERARKEDKPVFLSIGYSTCHWCHVMEHESFENPEIAALINQNFVPVKVDREERPDIDSIYMSAVMTMTGSGGWPLTVLLTQDKKPFFGGTYFPPQAKWGSPGLVDVISSVHEAWGNRRNELIESSDSLTEILNEQAARNAGEEELTPAILDSAFEQYRQLYDQSYGGFGRSPKFPTGHNLCFLLRYWKRTGNSEALEMVEHTLTQMANGGMYDHLGGGFHRYSTDQQWQVPHFEKMLYDQAILSRAYLEAYQITKKEFYAQVAREILDYVLRDMTHGQGGFYSAEDADSLDPDAPGGLTADPSPRHEKKEGAFYLWRHDEISEILGREDAAIFGYRFGIKPEGNALADPHGEFTGKNIIFAAKTIEETAAQFKTGSEDIKKSLERSKIKLFAQRKSRPRPHLDDKVLTDWNGLMISSLAFAARVLNEPRYQKAAEQSARFIRRTMIRGDGRLLHRYREGEAGILGTIEDYAFLIHGLLDLYEATFQLDYLKLGITLSDDMVKLFWDAERGGLYFTARDAEEILFRQKEAYDGAVPSGNSVAALDLVRIGHVTFNDHWEEMARALFDVFAGQMTRQPSSHAQMLSAFDFALGPSREIVIAASGKEDSLPEMIKEIYGRFMPNKVVLMRPASGSDADELNAISPFTKNQLAVQAQTTVYVCEDRVCKLPVAHPRKLAELLEQ